MIRIGIDFGGTKIEAAALDERGTYVARVRQPNPGEYGAAVETVVRLVKEARREAGISEATIGMGMPGSISPKTGRMRNANSVWLNDKPFKEDLERALGQTIRVENDANCFALSEATDGAAAGADGVFGAILGTGCGGGVVVRGRTVEGRNRIGGEWGHTPLPWPSADERATHHCWCGRTDCLETWISGSAFGEDYLAATGRKLPGDQIIAAMRQGEPEARSAFDRYVNRLGRALAVICDILDPDVIVFGGGMSNTTELYDRVPPVIARYAFSDVFTTRIVQAAHGDSSGVRGAAWLWPLD
ncbi:ROK family protein [Caulobacter sp. KR2-114]|uniref:ROK family protein n=1 Tax=Caulobacter sp. KR2-114 TaxID=3400912 RepID=UPI003C072E0B